MRLNRLLTLVGWAGVVAFLTAVTWTTASAIIDDVGGGRTDVLSASDINGLASATSVSAKGSTPTAPPPRPAATPTMLPPVQVPTPTSVTPNHTSNGHHLASPRPTPANSQNPRPSPTATTSATFAVPGGAVAVTCRQSSIALNYARPTDGWIVEVGNRGPEEVEVAFHSAHDSAEGLSASNASDTEIVLRCSGGVPIRS